MISPRAALALTVLASPSLALQAPQATNLQGFHRSGQTFLTYQESAPQGATYRMYRSAAPILSPGDLATATLLGEVDDKTSLNLRESTLLGSSVFYVIDPGQPPLGSLDGLLVHTPDAPGFAFYAVTRVEAGVENTSILAGPGGNSLATPIAEAVALPEPVLQGIQNPGNKSWYVQWTNPDDTPALPATSNRYAVTYNFTLQNVQPGSGSQPLVVGAHGGTSSYKTATQNTGNPNEIRLALDEPPPDLNLPQTPTDNLNTAWFGTNSNWLPGGASGNLLLGVNTDTTQRRVLATILWVLQAFDVDAERVYMAGRSMGGVATSAITFAHPEIFAAVHMLVPRFDFGEPEWNLERPNILDRYVPIWGTVAQNIVTSVAPPLSPAIFAATGDGLGVYDRMDQVFVAESFPGVDLPPAIVGVGKQDCFAGWHEKPRFIDAMESARQALALYWQPGDHGTNFNAGPWASEIGLAKLNRHRRDRSHPAFSGFSQDDDPGLGDDCIPGGIVTGAPQGTIHGRIDWDETTIVDEADRWGVEIFLNALATAPAGTVDVTPRRLQELVVAPGATFVFANADVATGAVVQVGSVAADSFGRPTMAGLLVTPTRNRIELRPAPSPGLVLFGDPAPGSTVAFAVSGPPAGAFVLALSPFEAVPPIPTPFGDLVLLPPILPLAAGAIPASGAAAVPVAVPPDPALSGATVHAQALAGASLTNGLAIAIP